MKHKHEDDLQWWLNRYKNVSHEDLVKEVRAMCLDWAETDTNVRELASKILDNYSINGDSYGVPGIEDIVEKLMIQTTIFLFNLIT